MRYFFQYNLIMTGSEKKKMRKSLFKEQGGKCFWCGRKIKHGGPSVHLDHVIPRCRNGSDDKDNIRMTCARCNSYKSGLKLTSWLTHLENQHKYWPKWNNKHRVAAAEKAREVIGRSRPVASNPEMHADIVTKEKPRSTIHFLMAGVKGERHE